MTVMVFDDAGNLQYPVLHDVTQEELEELQEMLPEGWHAEEM